MKKHLSLFLVLTIITTASLPGFAYSEIDRPTSYETEYIVTESGEVITYDEFIEILYKVSPEEAKIVERYSFESESNAMMYSAPHMSNRSFGSIAGVYNIPLLGEVTVFMTGVVIVAGIVYSATSSMARVIDSWVHRASKKDEATQASKNVPQKAKKSHRYVDLTRFKNKYGKTPKKGGQDNKYYLTKDKKWHIEKDLDNHYGYDGSVKIWKLFYKDKFRIASLNEFGKIIDK